MTTTEDEQAIAGEMTPEPDEPEMPDAGDDEPEPDEPDEDEPEAVAPEAAPAQSEKEMEKAAKNLEKESERHTAAVSRIMGEDSLALVPCELCEAGIPGFHWPASMLPDDDPRRTFYEMFETGDEGQMTQPERYARCDYCRGFGKVLTGSREPLTATLACPECKGAGYHDKNAVAPPTLHSVTVQPSGGDTPATAAVAPIEDFVGRPPGHPNYGKLTQYLTPAELALDVNDGYATP